MTTTRLPRTIAATNKRRGAMVEQTVATYLAETTGLLVERRRLTGAFDKGDLAGIPNVVVEIKSGQPQIVAWLRETEKERVNADAQVGVLWWAPPGCARRPERHVVIVRDTALDHTRQPYAPLYVPTRLIPRHTDAIGPAGIAGYYLRDLDAYVTSGEHAAREWNWRVYA